MSDTTSFIQEDPWRIFRIMGEFVDSFQTLSQVGLQNPLLDGFLEAAV